MDIGLRDTKNNEVPLTHAQLCSLYMHLHNKDSIEHLMTGGFVIPNAKYYSKGDIEQAYQKRTGRASGNAEECRRDADGR